MSPRLLAQVVAAGRVLTGITLFVSPTRITRHWVGPTEGDRAGTRVMAMGLGGRDIVVGAGVLMSLGQGGNAAKPWLLGSVASDLMDLIGTLRTASELPGGAVAGTVAIAGGATAAGFYLLSQDL